MVKILSEVNEDTEAGREFQRHTLENCVNHFIPVTPMGAGNKGLALRQNVLLEVTMTRLTSRTAI